MAIVVQFVLHLSEVVRDLAATFIQDTLAIHLAADEQVVLAALVDRVIIYIILGILTIAKLLLTACTLLGK